MDVTVQLGEVDRLLSGLNDQQRTAVLTTEGPVLILAGAGSGKTRVLTHRVAYLLGVKGVPPWNLLAITFTNKAAREMQERIAHLVGPAAKDCWIMTFHAMCVRILRRDIERMGYTTHFSILDPSDQLAVLKECLKEKNLDAKRYDPRAVLAAISYAKNELKDPERFARAAQTPYDRVVAELYALYQEKLKRNNALDFDDLLLVTVRLFEAHADVLGYYQNKFRYIHVDEYQDTNRAQYLLVRMLADRHRNLCVVGDSDQSIYSWRGADIRNILDFEADFPDAAVIKLEQNYRSTKRILRAANAVIAHNALRKPKELWTANPEGEPIRYYEAETEVDEALYVVDRIREGQAKGRKLSDFAVLYRTNAQSRALEEALMKAGIPYRVVGGIKFYERKEIKDLIAYLRLVANPDDDISLQRIVNVPKRGIGAVTLEKLAVFAAEQGLSLFRAMQRAEEAGVSGKTAARLADFVQLIENLAAMAEYLSVTELTEELLDRTGYREALKQEGTPEALGRLENIAEFLTVTKDFEASSEDKSLVAFLTELALISDVDRLDDEGPAEAVTLMTLHSAKGLEFPVVFLVGMEEGIFPHSRALADDEALEEERRLAYVGITRAMEELHLTSARWRTLFGDTRPGVPSRFLDEIPEAELQRVGGPAADPAGPSAGRPAPWWRRTPEGTFAATGAAQRRVPAPKDTVFQPGDKVRHAKWGIGTVVKVKGSGSEAEIDVAFPAPTGVKKLLAAYAPIEKVK
nr:DNA helicase PcrA [Bacillota bacterium]